VKSARVAYFQQQERKREQEQRERERIARQLEEERLRQEAEAERRRAEEQAEQMRQEAETRRIAAEAEAERLRNRAAEEASERARQEAEQRAKEIEEQAARDAQRANETAAQIEQAGQETADAIASQPVHVTLGPEPGERLTGVAGTWCADREKWDSLAFALWIAENPQERHIYIGEPAWKVIDARAKQQKSKTEIGGITVYRKLSGRAGK
jgi:hypothetical protein